MSDSSPISGDTPSCSQCGKPLSKRDEDRSTCNACRSARGKMADLDIAIRANGDDPNRIPEWPDIRYLLRKRFGEQSYPELLDRFRDWLSVERGFSEEEYLLLPFDEVKDLLADESAFDGGDPPTVKPKRSTERYEAQTKLIAALTMHHQYAEGGCLNLEPVSGNELARMAKVSNSSASRFLKKYFGSHSKYRAACQDKHRLIDRLKTLNRDFSLQTTYGARPPNENDRGD